MIPDTWKLTIVRDWQWKAFAEKKEGNRNIQVSTYDAPQDRIEDCLNLLEQRIKE